MKRDQSDSEKLQRLAAQIERSLDRWEKLDVQSLSQKVGKKMAELTEVEIMLRSKVGGSVRLQFEQLQNLRGMLHQLLKDRGLQPREHACLRLSPKHSARPDETYKAIRTKYDNNRLLLQTLLQAKSPRDNCSPQDTQTDRVLKYRQKYERLKQRYNELLEVAKCMEQEIVSIQSELEERRRLEGESLKIIEEVRNDNGQLRKQQALLQAEQLNKDVELRELKKELQKKESLCYDRNFLEGKLAKYDELVRKLKLEYEQEASHAALLQQELRQKCDTVLNDNRALQEQYSRLAIKHEKLCIDFDRKERQCAELQHYQHQLQEVEAEVLQLKEELKHRRLDERERVMSIELINSRVENQRKANQQLEQELMSSIREKQELMGQLQDQRELKKDIEQIATAVDSLRKENQVLRSNMTRSSRSQTKFKVISQLQDMVRLHKLQLKESRR